jgi:hypothetical protein
VTIQHWCGGGGGAGARSWPPPPSPDLACTLERGHQLACRTTDAASVLSLPPRSGNHGAMSTSPAVNIALGLCNDLIGGASLTWRYHHQASALGSGSGSGGEGGPLRALPVAPSGRAAGAA